MITQGDAERDAVRGGPAAAAPASIGPKELLPVTVAKPKGASRGNDVRTNTLFTPSQAVAPWCRALPTCTLYVTCAPCAVQAGVWTSTFGGRMRWRTQQKQQPKMT